MCAEIVKLFGEALRAQDTTHNLKKLCGPQGLEGVKILGIG